jgi:CHAD domain-containing protein
VKKLKQYARQRFKKLTDSLTSYGHVQDPAEIHNIRVEIKKIKALINMVNFCVRNFKSHQQFVPLRTIFRRAGEIRQPEVVYQLLLLYQIGGILDAQIPKSVKTDKLSAAFQKEVPQFLASVKLQSKKIKVFYKKVSKAEARKYLKNQKLELKKSLFPTFDKVMLHKSRKIIKEIIYLYWVEKNQKLPRFYKEAETIIGQWHDKQVLLPVLRKSKATDEIATLTAACKDDIIKLKKRIAAYYQT